MGNRSTKSSLRNAIIYLNISAEKINASDENFWNQIFTEDLNVADEIIKSISTQEIRMLRDGSPRNFSLLAYKMVEKLNASTKTLCNTQSQQTAVLNAIRILTRVIPCAFEDKDWHDFFEINTFDEKLSGDEINIVYPEKSPDEKNYESYLPTKSGARVESLSDACMSDQDNAQANSHFHSRKDTTDVQNDRSRPLKTPDLLISEDLISISLSERANTETNLAESETKVPRENNPPYEKADDKNTLMYIIIQSICDLLFCPEFTVLPHGDGYLSNTIDGPPDDLRSLSTHDYVWEPGVGFDSNANSTTYYDKNRCELMKLLLVSLSQTLYQTPDRSTSYRNKWIEIFLSSENRHALPLFTSLLNVVFIYKPPRQILQFSSSGMNEENRETLVILSMHLLMAALDYKTDDISDGRSLVDNLFIEYMSRIHRDEDFNFIIQGFVRLMNIQLVQTGFLWIPSQQIEIDSELMLLFWRISNFNKKFLVFLSKSSETLDIVVPILYHLNKNFQDPSRTALIHLGVFNLLALSGERNFGVSLNKPYSGNLLENLPEFNGSHADLLIIVFHKLIMYGYKINQLYNYLLNIMVNISPYVKSLTMLASKCIIQLFETFSSPYVIFTEPNYHKIVIFLLEVFNNLIQYQFDGNSNLIYIILVKKDLFSKLASMSTAQNDIDKVIRKLVKRKSKVVQARRLELEEASTTSHIMDKNEDRSMDYSNEEGVETDTATVSYEMAQGSSNPRRKEVSLVPTPDMEGSTHLTQVCMADTEPAIGTEPKKSNVTQKDTENSAITLDDLINQSQEISANNGIQIDCASPDNCSPYRVKEVAGDPDITDTNQADVTHSRADSESEGKPTPGEKWRPTSEWFSKWKRSLPLQTVLRTISVLAPQVDHFKRSTPRADQNDIINFLQSGTLVGLLPLPHPILIRKYRTNEDSIIWFRTCTWAIIYIKSNSWTNTKVRLIRVL